MLAQDDQVEGARVPVVVQGHLSGLLADITGPTWRELLALFNLLFLLALNIVVGEDLHAFVGVALDLQVTVRDQDSLSILRVD